MRGLLVLSALGMALIPFPGLEAQELLILPEPFEYPPCDVPAPVLFAQLDTMLENLEFDGNGTLFVTAFADGLFRLDVNKTVEHVAVSDRTRAGSEVEPFQISTAFMGVAVGADGALYVAEGHGIGLEVDGRVLRFPVPGEGEYEVFADGFPNTNGLAADRDGNLYLAHGFRDELWKIGPDGEWELWTRVPDVVNGIVEHPDGERLVIAPVGDASDSVFAIPLDRPDQRELLFRFRGGPSMSGDLAPDPMRPMVNDGIDDLGMTLDGRILASGHATGQFLMGDPATGEACILLDGARGEPSSIREARGFGEWDGWAFTTDFSGDVWAIDVRTGDTDAQAEADPGPDADGPDADGPEIVPPVLLLLLVLVIVVPLALHRGMG